MYTISLPQASWREELETRFCPTIVAIPHHGSRLCPRLALWTRGRTPSPLSLPLQPLWPLLAPCLPSSPHAPTAPLPSPPHPHCSHHPCYPHLPVPCHIPPMVGLPTTLLLVLSPQPLPTHPLSLATPASAPVFSTTSRTRGSTQPRGSLLTVSAISITLTLTLT